MTLAGSHQRQSMSQRVTTVNYILLPEVSPSKEAWVNMQQSEQKFVLDETNYFRHQS